MLKLLYCTVLYGNTLSCTVWKLTDTQARATRTRTFWHLGFRTGESNSGARLMPHNRRPQHHRGRLTGLGATPVQRRSRTATRILKEDQVEIVVRVAASLHAARDLQTATNSAEP